MTSPLVFFTHASLLCIKFHSLWLSNGVCLSFFIWLASFLFMEAYREPSSKIPFSLLTRVGISEKFHSSGLINSNLFNLWLSFAAFLPTHNFYYFYSRTLSRFFPFAKLSFTLTSKTFFFLYGPNIFFFLLLLFLTENNTISTDTGQ